MIVGGAGEFGQFLQRDILPHICVKVFRAWTVKLRMKSRSRYSGELDT